jgi:hypothetical protein
MSQRVFEQLDLPTGTEIRWGINTYVCNYTVQKPWNGRADTNAQREGWALALKIKHPDGRGVIQFAACKAEHERNRTSAWHADDLSIGNVPLNSREQLPQKSIFIKHI